MRGSLMKPFQPDRGARLLEVDAHHEHERVATSSASRRRRSRVVERGVRIVDRAGADDDEEARVRAVEDALERRAAGGDGLGRDVGERDAARGSRRAAA